MRKAQRSTEASMQQQANTTDLQPAPPAAMRGRVLLATADAAEQARIAACLDAADLCCEIVADGARAVELALAGSIDVLLIDTDLPRIDGLSVAALLRAAGLAMPMVAVSASVAPADVARYTAAGCSHWLAGPVDAGALRALLAGLLPKAPLPALSLAQLAGFAAVRRSFDAGLGTRLARIDGLLGSADLPGAAALAHMLKGSAGSFGYPRVSELAGRIEQALLDGDAGTAALLLAQLRQLDEVRQLLPPAA
jgi:CheY-like chemotaxis protein